MSNKLITTVEGHQIYIDGDGYAIFHPANCARPKGMGPTELSSAALVIDFLEKKCDVVLLWSEEQRLMEKLSEHK